MEQIVIVRLDQDKMYSDVQCAGTELSVVFGLPKRDTALLIFLPLETLRNVPL